MISNIKLRFLLVGAVKIGFGYCLKIDSYHLRLPVTLIFPVTVSYLILGK
jgi:hypothetical protein